MEEKELDFNQLEQDLNREVVDQAERERTEQERTAERLRKEDLTPLAKFIIRKRTQAGLSINELGRNAGVDPSVVSRVELGETKNPPASTLRALAKGLNVPVAELYTKAGVTRPDDLPAIEPYLRTKYGRALPKEARAQIADYFAVVAEQYGIDPTDTAGDDEAPPA